MYDQSNAIIDCSLEPSHNIFQSEFLTDSILNVNIQPKSSAIPADLSKTQSVIPSIGGNMARDISLKFQLDNDTGAYLQFKQLSNKSILSLVAKNGNVLNSIEINNELPNTNTARNKYLYITNQGVVTWKDGLDSQSTKILYDTTENWNAQPSLLSEINTLYVYTDGDPFIDESGNITYVAKIKIGDGNAYLIDKPFITDAISKKLSMHLTDAIVHIQPGEREKWNNKLNYIEPGDNSDLLEFTRN